MPSIKTGSDAKRFSRCPLEIELIRELRAYAADEAQGELDAAILSLINVDQFYGIEIGEFPARIAEITLWMMDHIMNNRLSLEFGQIYVRIPLHKSGSSTFHVETKTRMGAPIR
ncbi:DNA methyltransferase [Roseospira goensis]|uniref:DNA methyltransferase n=1 Tax=Roseospira goensis TaxID=391922 RepID=UPI003CCCDC37